jgi:hypothetical protein
MEEHHWGGQGWNPAVEPEEEEEENCRKTGLVCSPPLNNDVIILL